MFFSISKHSFSKIRFQLMPMTGVIGGVVTPKEKTISKPQKKRQKTWKTRDKSTSKKKNKLWDNTHVISHTHTLIQITPPPFPIIYIKTMGAEFLAQMRQSNKRNDKILNLHLGSGVGPWVSIPSLLQDTCHIYWFHPPIQLIRKKQRTQKRDSTINKLYCTSLVYVPRTQP